MISMVFSHLCSVPQSELNNEVYTSADNQWGQSDESEMWKEKECTGKKMDVTQKVLGSNKSIVKGFFLHNLG